MPNLRKLHSTFVLLFAQPALVLGFSVQRIQHMQAHQCNMGRKHQKFPLTAGLDEDNNQAENSNDEMKYFDLQKMQDNFDGKGLANYLGPYVVALGVSIAVAAAFIKFVLLDY